MLSSIFRFPQNLMTTRQAKRPYPSSQASVLSYLRPLKLKKTMRRTKDTAKTSLVRSLSMTKIAQAIEGEGSMVLIMEVIKISR